MFSQIRPYLVTAGFGVLIAYFGFHALTGDKGLLNEATRKATLAERTDQLQRVTAERRELEARVTLLSDEHLSKDLLEERARVLLGYTDPRDYVIRIQGPETRRS